MPLALALVAGGLSVLNPCGFSLLPSMLGFYAEGQAHVEDRRARAAHALTGGLLVAGGFLAVFCAVGLLVVFGLGGIVRAIPWFGVVVGIGLLAAGAVTISGRGPALGLGWAPQRRPRSTRRTLFLFGVAYAISSLGCTLPVFLSVVGSSLAARGASGGVVVLGVYSLGTTLVMIAVAFAAGSLGAAALSRARALMPYVHRTSGVLLMLAGAYLTYYWSRNLLGSPSTLARDPVVGPVLRFTSMIERVASSHRQLLLLALGGLVVAVLARLVVHRASPISAETPAEESAEGVSERALDRIDAR